MRAYSLLLLNLREIYSALEESMEANRGHPAVKPLIFEGLERTGPIGEDLDYYFRNRSRPSPTLAAMRYSEQLREIGKRAPHLLGAHAYVRYMGDLSGGQIIAGIVKEVLNLTPPQGLAFYTFSKVAADDASAVEFKARYRTAIDTLPLDEEQQAAAVENARAAFRSNIEVFDAILPLLLESENGRPV